MIRPTGTCTCLLSPTRRSAESWALHLVEGNPENESLLGDIELAVHVEPEVAARRLHLGLVDVADRDLGAQIVQCGRGGQSDSPGRPR